MPQEEVKPKSPYDDIGDIPAPYVSKYAEDPIFDKKPTP